MNGRTRRYEQIWLEHVGRMEEGPMSKQVFAIGPTEEQILVEHANLEFTEAGESHRHNP
jgi:hypothetical protein